MKLLNHHNCNYFNSWLFSTGFFCHMRRHEFKWARKISWLIRENLFPRETVYRFFDHLYLLGHKSKLFSLFYQCFCLGKSNVTKINSLPSLRKNSSWKYSTTMYSASTTPSTNKWRGLRRGPRWRRTTVFQVRRLFRNLKILFSKVRTFMFLKFCWIVNTFLERVFSTYNF